MFFNKMFGAIVQVAFRISPPAFHFAIRDRLSPKARQRIRSLLGARDIRQFQSYLSAQSLEKKLWAGFSETALSLLEAMKFHPTTRREDVHDAAWALGRWYYAQGDIQKAYENAVLMRLVAPSRRDLRQTLLEVDCLCRLGQGDIAQLILKPLIEKHKLNPHLVLALANTYRAIEEGNDDYDEVRLDLINSLYRSAGLLTIKKNDSAEILTLSNITVIETRARSQDQSLPRVSVIIPAFNARLTLARALDSLLLQTWENLELIVVDDGSMDETYLIGKDYASNYSKIKLIRQEINRGAYSARNIGLTHATGEFITTHDADDWAHPEKISNQVLALMKNPRSPGNMSHCVRVDDNFCFHGPYRASDRMVLSNFSSLMLRKINFESLGGWDEVRVSADAELIHRLEYHHGGRKIDQVHIGVPLTLVHLNNSSLTRQSRTHIRTLYHGIRKEYQAAARHWLSQRRPSDINIQPGCGLRKFPAPRLICQNSDERLQFDLVFIMDFNMIGGAYVSTMNYVAAALKQGYTVGLFHWRRFDLDVTSKLRPEIRNMAQDGVVKLVSPGEIVNTCAVIVGYPGILQYPIDLAPQFETDKFYIIVNQMAARLFSGSDIQYDPGEVSQNIRRLFGINPQWIPISGLVMRLMISDGRYQPILPWIWNPLIDTESWCSTALRWRGDVRRLPVIGRHSRDHYTKWPANPDDLRAAYCADRPCEVRLLGGIRFALDVMKKIPKNWNHFSFGAMESKDFLRDIDFFVHYPHDDYIEEFGRAIIEAMAVGVPVILPPCFKETFGAAAIYKKPEEVWSAVLMLWNDQEAYLEQARIGRAYVLEHCDWGKLVDRLDQAGIVLHPAESDSHVCDGAIRG